MFGSKTSIIIGLQQQKDSCVHCLNVHSYSYLTQSSIVVVGMHCPWNVPFYSKSTLPSMKTLPILCCPSLLFIATVQFVKSKMVQQTGKHGHCYWIYERTQMFFSHLLRLWRQSGFHLFLRGKVFSVCVQTISCETKDQLNAAAFTSRVNVAKNSSYHTPKQESFLG